MFDILRALDPARPHFAPVDVRHGRRTLPGGDTGDGRFQTTEDGPTPPFGFDAQARRACEARS